MVSEHAPSAIEVKPKKHVTGDKMRDIVALVRGAGDYGPLHTTSLGQGQQKDEKRKRRRIIERDRRALQRHAVKTDGHVVNGIDCGAAGPK